VIGALRSGAVMQAEGVAGFKRYARRAGLVTLIQKLAGRPR